MSRIIRNIAVIALAVLCIAAFSVVALGSGEVSVDYEFSTNLPGRADGTVTLKTSGYNGENYTLCWGTETGLISAYEPLADVAAMKVSGNVLKYDFAPLTMIPEDATHLWVTLDGGLVEEFEIPQERKLTFGTPKYSFGMLSDLHFGSANAVSAFEAAMEYYSARDVSFVAVSGDNTCGGTRSQWNDYASNYSAFSEIPLWFVLGNHDALAWNLTVTPEEAMENVKAAFPNYANENHSYGDAFKVTSGYHVEYDYSMEYQGDLYLFMGIGAASNDSEDKNIDQKLSDDQLEWLDETLAEYYGRSGRGNAFLIFHYYTLESGMSVRGNGTEWNKDSSRKLHNVLEKYPGVIYFNGHTHYTFDCDLNSYTGKYASIHLPSLAYGGQTLEGKGHLEGYEGYLVEVYDGYVTVTGVDFYSGQTAPRATFLLHDRFFDGAAVYGVALRTTAGGAVQWRAKGGGGSWAKIAELSELDLSDPKPLSVSEYVSVEFRATETHLQWRVSGSSDDAWSDLIELKDIAKTGDASEDTGSDTDSASGGDGGLSSVAPWVWGVIGGLILALAGGIAAIFIVLFKKK